VCVYSPTYGYAGQADAFLTIDQTRFLADYKTSREPYDGGGQLKTPYGRLATTREQCIDYCVDMLLSRVSSY
jgi:hypothetical protein